MCMPFQISVLQNQIQRWKIPDRTTVVGEEVRKKIFEDFVDEEILVSIDEYVDEVIDISYSIRTIIRSTN